jgi:hypothetical protein
MKKSLFTLFIALFALMSIGFADSIHTTTADTSIALRFKNFGAEDAVFNFDAGDSATNNITIGSTVNTLDFSGAGADTIVEIAALIAAVTNSAGVPVLLMDTRCALGTDSTDDELLDTQTITVPAKVGSVESWGELLWDTSVHLSYDIYIPAALQDPNKVRSPLDIDHIYGNPLGTGDGTLSIYIGGELAWQYQMPELFAATNAVRAEVQIPALKESVLIRAARATTATTGHVGVKMTTPVQQ